MFDQKNFSKKEGRQDLLKKFNDFFLNYFHWLVFLLVLLVLALVSLFFLYPQYKEVERVVNNYEEQQEDLFLKKQKDLNKIRDYISSYEKISAEEREDINSMLPEEYNQEELFSELSHLVEKNNLILKSIGVSKKTTATTSEGNLDIQEYEVDMSVVGVNYYSLKNFLNTLENNIRLLDVDQIRFAPESMSVNLNLSTYYLK